MGFLNVTNHCLPTLILTVAFFDAIVRKITICLQWGTHDYNCIIALRFYLTFAKIIAKISLQEANVIQLEAGNLEADDSEIKRKYDNQRQLNIQLAEQKRWLEHELEQIKLKIQNEKLNLLPDPFALDWDALSETEMKRLVGQLEKTRNDLRSDLR